MKKVLRPLEDRFWEKVDVRGPNECWPWTASRLTGGYGQIGRGRVREGNVGAHILSWELANGPVPKGLLVLHHCDNPPCCNPAHLFLGTQLDNMKDAAAKGRLRPPVLKGEANPNAKLSNELVREIRQRYKNGGVTIYSLARDYGVSKSLIAAVVKGEVWRHLNPRL